MVVASHHEALSEGILSGPAGRFEVASGPCPCQVSLDEDAAFLTFVFSGIWFSGCPTSSSPQTQ